MKIEIGFFLLLFNESHLEVSPKKFKTNEYKIPKKNIVREPNTPSLRERSNMLISDELFITFN